MRRIVVAKAVLVSLLALFGGCRTGDEAKDATHPRLVAHDDRPLMARFPIRPRLRWTSHTEEGGAATTEEISEVWSPIDATSWDVRAHSAGAPPAAEFRTRNALTKSGFVTLAVAAAGELVFYDPPKVMLPLDAHVGQTWVGEHAFGQTKPKPRSCRVDDAPECAGGLSVACKSFFPDGRSFVDTQIYCAGIGWSGFRSFQTTTDGKTVASRSWSTDVRDE